MSETKCDETAYFKFYWPGKEEPSLCCEKHAKKARPIAQFMGFGLAIEPIEPGVAVCQQVVDS